MSDFNKITNIIRKEVPRKIKKGTSDVIFHIRKEVSLGELPSHAMSQGTYHPDLLKKAKGIIDKTVPASTEDVKILSSDSTENIMKKCIYQDPKTGKKFHIIKHPVENNPSRFNYRLLDEQGKLINEKIISNDQLPKIVIIDDFTQPNLKFSYSGGANISHGDGVKQHALRNNPFANYECINHATQRREYSGFIDMLGLSNKSIDKANECLEAVLQRVKSGEKIDYISNSWNFEKNRSIIEKMLDHNLNKVSSFEQKKTIKEKLFQLKNLSQEDLIVYLKKIKLEEMPENEEDIIIFAQKVEKIIATLCKTIELTEELTKNGTRVFFASGNGGADHIGLELLGNGAEGVGSLAKNGKVSKFSASRGNGFTQHYELGEYDLKVTPKGYNYTNTEGIDAPLNDGYFERYAGKKPDDVVITKKEIDKIKSSGDPFELWAYGKKLIKTEDYADFINDATLKEILLNELKGKYMSIRGNKVFDVDKNGEIIPFLERTTLNGTSFACPAKVAKLSLQDMVEKSGLLP